jgi:hypothetical protein
MLQKILKRNVHTEEEDKQNNENTRKNKPSYTSG